MDVWMYVWGMYGCTDVVWDECMDVLSELAWSVNSIQEP